MPTVAPMRESYSTSGLADECGVGTLNTSKCEERRSKTPDLLSIGWQPSTSSAGKEKEEFEITIDNDKAFSGGLAFRIIGNRNSGIFIDHVDNKSVQSGYLRQGDRIVSCGERRLSGMTIDQAASILRFNLARNGSVRLKVERNERGEELIVRRRSMTTFAMEQDRRESHWELPQLPPNPSPLKHSKSTTALDRRRVYRIVASKSLAYLRQPQSDDELELLPLESHESTSPPAPTGESSESLPMRTFFSFDTSGDVPVGRCGTCNRDVSMPMVHQLSHLWVNSAKRLLPNSRSEGAFQTTAYTVLS